MRYFLFKETTSRTGEGRLHNPETAMRSVAMTILAPMFAAVSCGLVLLYPNPAALVSELRPVGVVMSPVTEVGKTNADTAIETLAARVTDPEAGAASENADCFQDLSLADRAKLDRCAEVVYRALAEVEATRENPFVQQALNGGNREQVVQQLRLAATEVCRLKWTRHDGGVPTDSPACEVSLLGVDRPVN